MVKVPGCSHFGSSSSSLLRIPLAMAAVTCATPGCWQHPSLHPDVVNKAAGYCCVCCKLRSETGKGRRHGLRCELQAAPMCPTMAPGLRAPVAPPREKMSPDSRLDALLLEKKEADAQAKRQNLLDKLEAEREILGRRSEEAAVTATSMQTAVEVAAVMQPLVTSDLSMQTTAEEAAVIDEERQPASLTHM